VICRLVATLILASGLARGCTCFSPSAFVAKRDAKIIFRGTITGFRETGKTPMVVFHVDRVWKGDVPRTFEMPAVKEFSGCVGFWPDFLEVGKTLLVYAFQFRDGGEYETSICSRTAPAKQTRDAFSLGFGRPAL